jgi:predicted Fe-S protein YdhL (DUF1289 family)
LFAWKLLTQEERKQALKDLQSINKNHVYNALEVKEGQSMPRPGRFWKKGDQLKWRAWSKMTSEERQDAIEKLQVSFLTK